MKVKNLYITFQALNKQEQKLIIVKEKYTFQRVCRFLVHAPNNLYEEVFTGTNIRLENNQLLPLCLVLPDNMLWKNISDDTLHTFYEENQKRLVKQFTNKVTIGFQGKKEDM